MHEQDCPDKRAAAAAETAPETARGEFDQLLREIEKEPVPERLLELALKLQAALVERRGDARKEDGPDRS
ncbi:MAG TPA: hypothetical protein PL183_02015 [Aquamicrobium sp.]|nr:hypothetical protein [Aquamicrobium sp.]